MKDSLNLLKELRDATGAGILDCKKYLKKANDNLEKAIKLMRSEEGIKADGKSSRVAAEGLIYFCSLNEKFLLIEINSETDFVARSNDFKVFVEEASLKILSSDYSNFNDLLKNKKTGIYKDIEEMRKNTITKLGENIQIRRYVLKKQTNSNYISGYIHNGKIGAMVTLKNKDEQLSKDISMQIVASNPLALDYNSVDSKILADEKEIYKAELEKLNKKDDIKRNIIEGKIKKFLNNNTLLDQPFIKDEKTTLRKIIKKNEIIDYTRYNLGEGLKKEEEDFAKEVYKQIK